MKENRGPTVAVVGRQNVGKSTLINRLAGRRGAIAHSSPGVTRDRVEVPVTWRGRRLNLLDTAGYIARASGLEARALEQADRALEQADLIVLVVDARTGIVGEDTALAKRLRRGAAPVLVVANKADSGDDDTAALGFIKLGLGEPLAVSALHGRGTGDLMDRLVQIAPSGGSARSEEDEVPRFAIVGRPNVGKSTLFNRLVGKERALVDPTAGTTRDPVDDLVEWPDGPVRFIDTAGLRREVKVKGIEYFSLVRTGETIERSQVAVLVFDASQGLTGEDKKIANKVIEAGRALLLAANKWDLVEDKDRTFKGLTEESALLARAEVVRTSAMRGQGVPRLPPLLMDLHGRWGTRVSTSRVNEVFQQAQRERPVPRGGGALHYATQVSAGPPSFVVFGSKAPPPAYRRYLENRLRAEFGFEGVPIRMRFRPRQRRTPN
jgi:GTPase